MSSSAGSPIGFKGMIVPAEVLTVGSIDVLLDPGNIDNARKVFRKKTKDFTYKSAIPLDRKPPMPEVR